MTTTTTSSSFFACVSLPLVVDTILYHIALLLNLQGGFWQLVSLPETLEVVLYLFHLTGDFTLDLPGAKQMPCH